MKRLQQPKRKLCRGRGFRPVRVRRAFKGWPREPSRGPRDLEGDAALWQRRHRHLRAGQKHQRPGVEAQATIDGLGLRLQTPTPFKGLDVCPCRFCSCPIRFGLLDMRCLKMDVDWLSVLTYYRILVPEMSSAVMALSPMKRLLMQALQAHSPNPKPGNRSPGLKAFFKASGPFWGGSSVRLPALKCCTHPCWSLLSRVKISGGLPRAWCICSSSFYEC